MTTILAAFVLALVTSLALTPVAGRLGKKLGAVDEPDERKIHTVTMPRTGGLAIVVSFALVLILTRLYQTEVTRLLAMDGRTWGFLLGGLMAFGIGLVDDFRRVHPGIKFVVHVGAATVAFWGGLRIGAVGIVSSSPLGLVWAYGLTVFWFVLIINAVNLVDGMDGLAGGIVVFASLVMIALSVMRNEYLSGMLFAILAGAALGFLRYNFNPASIFLGDGGSYFLGYAIAGLSILSGAKMQMGAVLLIPVMALGLPLFDTVLAPIRRFIRGKGMFSPDREHIHHRLKAIGLTSRSVTLVCYGISAGLCVLALLVVNLRDERAGLLLILLGIGAVFFIRRLGYFEYFALDKFYGWLRDMTDVAGLSRERRSFLNLQMEMASARDLDGLWAITVAGLRMLRIDLGEMVLGTRNSEGGTGRGVRSKLSESLKLKAPGEKDIARSHRGAKMEAARQGMCAARDCADPAGQEAGARERRGGLKDRRVRVVDPATLGFPDRRRGPRDRRRKRLDNRCPICGQNHWTQTGWQATWVREGFDVDKDICEECLMKLELPLLREDGENLGTLWLVKDLKREPVSHYTLRRIEHLRRTLISALTKLHSPPTSSH